MPRLDSLLAIRFRYLLCLITLVAVAVLSDSDAADLRTTVANRPLLRSVSYEVPAEPAAVFQNVDPVPRDIYSSEIDFGQGCDTCCEEACCCPPFGFGMYGDVEFLLWWRRGRRMPPLITGAPANAAPVLGLPTTDILFGDDTYGGEAHAGSRVTIGTWLDPYRYRSLQGSFYSLGRDTVQFEVAANATAPGGSSLGRPFEQGGVQFARALAVQPSPPGNNPGTADVFSRSQVYGGDAILKQMVYETDLNRVNILSGYQFTRVFENLVVSDTTTNGGAFQSISDIFETRNEFHGGTIGFEWTHYGSNWQVELLGKLGFGTVRQSVIIDAASVNAMMTGFLANAGNEGRRNRNKFSFSPEISARLVYSLADWIDLSMGYSFIHWTNMVQPGDHVSLNFVPAGAVSITPFMFDDRSYWVHGFNCGLLARF